MTTERTTEELVRSYAKAFGDTTEPVADHNDIYWMAVGWNASHTFELGWDDMGLLYKRSSDEEGLQVTTQVEHEAPGYVGHH